MRRVGPWGPVAAVFVLMVAGVSASAVGWLGPLVACGADGAAVCVTWPGAASLATWLVFVATIVGLLAWQVREWRRDPNPFAKDD